MRTTALPVIETLDDEHANAAVLPLRFTWQMDREGRFTLGMRGIHPPDRSAHRRPLRPAMARDRRDPGLDPEGRVMQAVATRETWSGITLDWPVDGGDQLPVELSGLPISDAARNFAGYRGFGVCRDLDALARLAARRRNELFGETAAPQESPAADCPPDRRNAAMTAEST